MYDILSREELSPYLLRLKIAAPAIARKAQPGQFVIVMVDEKGERIPLTLAGWQEGEGNITLVISPVGKTTTKIGRLKGGDRLAHVVGPLGQPSQIENVGTVAFVAMGYSLFTLLPIARALRVAGNRLLSLLWKPEGILLDAEEEWCRLSHLVRTTAQEASAFPPFIIQPLRELLTQEKIDQVRIQAPACVMKWCSLLTKPLKVKTIVSLNPLMVDATGMCGACRVTVGGKTKFGCVDGPEFDGQEVDWDELLARRCTYAGELPPVIAFNCRFCAQW